MTPLPHDPVNHPFHYTSHPSGVECITITRHYSFCLGNTIKYIWRAGLKADSIEDLEKAIFYLREEIDRLKDARKQIHPAEEGERTSAPASKHLHHDDQQEEDHPLYRSTSMESTREAGHAYSRSQLSGGDLTFYDTFSFAEKEHYLSLRKGGMTREGALDEIAICRSRPHETE